MKRFYRFAIVAGFGLVLAATPVWAAGTNPTVSDDLSNTAGGSEALLDNFNSITNSGDFNTAFGRAALQNNTSGGANTATGQAALGLNTSGGSNTATGQAALFSNSSGGANTAAGSSALMDNTSGSNNTATGYQALFHNKTDGNTATGYQALFTNNTGSANTADGNQALKSNLTGANNTGTGQSALVANSTGNMDTAVGAFALGTNSSGSNNTAAGVNALFFNTIGVGSTAVGVNALVSNTSGSNNIGLGFNAGDNLTTGSSNIDIGNAGVAAESKTIRIGSVQTAAFIAGISGTMVTGAPVEVSSTGQLGIAMSSARYKRDIADMGDRTSGLLKLRPVTFRYKNDQSGTLQYGLVAEEVAKVYPELVIYGPDGKVMTVRYSMLSAMLLNELQKQTKENQRQASQIQQLAEQQAAQNRRWSAQMAQLKGMFQQAITVQSGTRSLAEAFNR